MKQVVVKLASLVFVATLCIGAMAGCASGASSLDESQQANRSYMSQVNGIMDELGSNLDSFTGAVSRNDLVNMRTQAENAYKALDELSALEAPEDLADVKQKYVDGTAKLREALDGYITLFTDVSSDSFDQAAYSNRIADVQSLYDEGVDLLKQADEAAAAK